jgi:hypothetical protein
MINYKERQRKQWETKRKNGTDIPWNKGKTNLPKLSKETKDKIGIAGLGNTNGFKKGQSAWNKGKGKFKNKEDRQKDRNFRKYGINEIKYNEILASQNYVCAICLKPETKKHQNGNITRLSIDHEHETGRVRGLLCSKCNFAIGQLNDNPYLCEKAMQYLLNN